MASERVDQQEEGTESPSVHLDALAKIVTSRRGKQALEVLREEINSPGRAGNSSSGKPSFPNANTVAAMSGSNDSAKGGYSS